MQCPRCKIEVLERDNFCRNCGRALSWPPGPTWPSATKSEATASEERTSTDTTSTETAPSAPSSPTAPPVTSPTPPTPPATSPVPEDLAGFWRRLGAWLIDLLVVGVTGFLLAFWAAIVIQMAGGDLDDRELSDRLDNGTAAFGYLAAFGTLWAFNAFGWTPGKQALGLRIVREGGQRPGISAGLARTIGAPLSGLVLGLGYLWAAWDGRKQTWHDKIAGTFVVRTQPDSSRVVAPRRPTHPR